MRSIGKSNGSEKLSFELTIDEFQRKFENNGIRENSDPKNSNARYSGRTEKMLFVKANALCAVQSSIHKPAVYFIEFALSMDFQNDTSAHASMAAGHFKNPHTILEYNMRV